MQTARMAAETYIPTEVTFAARPVQEVFAVTLHDPDSAAPHGALTTHHPPEEGARGALVITGRREGRTWRVTLPEIEIVRRTAVGCEYNIFGRVRREVLATQDSDERQRC